MKYCLYLLVCLSLMQCSSRDVKAEIAVLENQLAEDPDLTTMQALMKAYQDGAEMAKNETERLMYTWKSGETARGLKDYPTAERILSGVYDNHAESEYASKALFLHAFMLDEDQNDQDRARTLYTRFIESYPESDFKDDAEFLLANLGKSDEEILRTLTEKRELSPSAKADGN